MSMKTISMACHDENGGTVVLTQRFDENCTWNAIAFQFYKFLSSQSYVLQPEDVGADIEAFILSTENEGVF